MLQALLQTLANLGFDSQAINESFNNIMTTIRSGDPGSLDGIAGMFRGLLSAFTGVDQAQLSLIANSVLTSVLELLSNAGTSGVLSTITGA